ncbi:MAG: sodium transporter [Bacteroidota bacterium]|nr:sodium transporter [Bacteroidota bacterium]MDP4226649.1 sodium transporter [Bacteroidota bacterium]MDP4274274.1 sodium transporter [Bacteroidota bacterium]
MTGIDYIVIVFFSLLIVFIGLSFSRKAGSDMVSFFAAGGAVPWWINSLSLFMGFVSASTFVVWGSIAYSSGWVAISIQWAMSVAGLVVGYVIAPKWHKTRSLTAAEYICNRLGIRTQKTYSYIYLFIMVFLKGVCLYAVALILQITTGISLYWWVGLLGAIVILYTTFGGLWAVVVTDVLQFIILLSAGLILLPLSFDKVGGVSSFVNIIHSQNLPDFFKFSDQKYTISFLLGFLFYNIFYLGGQWSFIQRYTSVASPKESKMVGVLFGLFYIISPVIWMLPPMIYRAVNPGLVGIENEQAYMQMAKAALPSGMLGLITISLVFATNSSVQSFLNISAGVITNDLFKNIYPQSSGKLLMRVARIATLSMGIVVIFMGMLVPLMGGATNVILSVASITGGAMYFPLIWTLFSKKQNSYTVLATTILSLFIALAYKFVIPYFSGKSLSRASEMLLGVLVPISIIMLFEIWLRFKNSQETEFENYQRYLATKVSSNAESSNSEVDSKGENQFGKRMISIGILATGLIIAGLGLLSPCGKIYVLGMALLLLMIGFRILYKTLK